MRYYGFSKSDVIYQADGNLPLDRDPKVAWAIAQPALFPVDVMRAGYEMLLRVPGIGVLTAKRIIQERRTTQIRSLADLRKLGVQARAAGFLLLHGRALQAHRLSEQLSFWSAGDNIGAGHQIYSVSPGTFR